MLLAPHAAVPTPASPLQANRFFVLFLTFMCYTAYHASRRPLSIVKSVLNGEPLGGEGALLLGDMHGGGISGSSGGKGPVEMVWTASNISEFLQPLLLNPPTSKSWGAGKGRAWQAGLPQGAAREWRGRGAWLRGARVCCRDDFGRATCAGICTC